MNTQGIEGFGSHDQERSGGSPRGRPIFGETADPDAYVPRSASEAALSQLESVLQTGRCCAVLSGPPGLGKSLLLRILESRIRRTGRVVHLPYAALTLNELCGWVVALTGEPLPNAPAHRLREIALESGSNRDPLHLLIDDANSMPLETARTLGDLVSECGGALRLVLATPDDARSSRVVAALDLDSIEHRYDRPMSPDETRRYVSEHLRWANAEPEIWRCLNAECASRLHGLSGGNPRRLHVLASEVIRGEAGREILMRLEPEWGDLLLAAE